MIMTGPSTRYTCVSIRPVCGSFARRGDGEFALGLQQLQGIGRLLRSGLLDDGEDLVP